MKDVINNLYEKYNTKVESELENDDFYRYFYNLLETGTTLCQFYNRKLIKEVDTEWVDAIEKAMPHIQKVVDEPRKFIEEDRQIVNVALAKKFTAESVKHLSQHSEMVNKINEDGSVEPNKVLNVFKEESLNTYENRFIYTLLLELRNFINKRFDQLFDSSRDEDGIKLNLESVIDNYSETVSYKMEVRIREKQTDTSNDEENVNVFTRITKIHKTVLELTGSGFMLEMQKFPLVKHPVVKTNAISKHPSYKACYELWNFLHSYERVGYKVQVLEQDPMVSRPFEEDLYRQILLDYVVVRKYMENKDLLNIDKPKRKKEMGIKDVKQFVMQLVSEYDMSPSELRTLVANELESALKVKEKHDKMQEELQKRARGRTAITEDDEGWNDFTAEDSGPKDDKKTNLSKDREQQRIRRQIKHEKEIELKVKKELLEERKKAIANGTPLNDETAYSDSNMSEAELNKRLDELEDEFIDLALITGGQTKVEGYGNTFIEENVLTNARFAKLVRKLEKENKKREIKQEIVRKKSQEVGKTDADKAQKILDRAAQKEDRRVRKNEKARLYEIEKSKKDNERMLVKLKKKKSLIQEKEEKKRIAALNKENAARLKEEAKIARQEQKEAMLLAKEKHKLELEEQKEQERANKAIAKANQARRKAELKLQKKELAQKNKIEKARLKQELRMKKQEEKRLKEQRELEKARLAKEAKEMRKNEQLRLKLAKKADKQSKKLEKQKRAQLIKEANKRLRVEMSKQRKERREEFINTVKNIFRKGR